MGPLEDAGKNGWTVAHFSIMMVAMGDQIDCQICSHTAGFIAIKHQTCNPHTSVHRDHSQTPYREKHTPPPHTTALSTYACTLSILITLVLSSIRSTKNGFYGKLFLLGKKKRGAADL
ncbi:hypothetical protein TNCV_3151761 [Trichonephila clavipes]|nr:hypothetical protein TNCV_3151761 [Trichonephila clavipes]